MSIKRRWEKPTSLYAFFRPAFLMSENLKTIYYGTEFGLLLSVLGKIAQVALAQPLSDSWSCRLGRLFFDSIFLFHHLRHKLRQ